MKEVATVEKVIPSVKGEKSVEEAATSVEEKIDPVVKK